MSQDSPGATKTPEEDTHSRPVRVHFMCQLDEGMGAGGGDVQTFGLGVSVRVFLEEVNI